MEVLFMSKMQISMDYYPEGDMLSITFGVPGRKGRGYEKIPHKHGKNKNELVLTDEMTEVFNGFHYKGLS